MVTTPHTLDGLPTLVEWESLQFTKRTVIYYDILNSYCAPGAVHDLDNCQTCPFPRYNMCSIRSRNLDDNRTEIQSPDAWSTEMWHKLNILKLEELFNII